MAIQELLDHRQHLTPGRCKNAVAGKIQCIQLYRANLQYFGEILQVLESQVVLGQIADKSCFLPGILLELSPAAQQSSCTLWLTFSQIVASTRAPTLRLPFS